MAHPVYTVLSKVIYPVFTRKLQSVTGAELLPPTGGFLVACNHVDWLDAFYLAAAIDRARHVPTYFLTKSNNYWWTTVAMQIPPDHGSIISPTVERLRRGIVIGNFPEGQRNPAPKLLPGKTGTVRMAAEAGVPVIPAGIACEAGRTMGQSLQYLWSSRHRVALAIGRPLSFNVPSSGMTTDWLENETARLMRAIAPLAGKSVY